MKKRALFVGVDRYEDGAFRDLRYSVADAAALAAAFGRYGYDTHVATNPGTAELLKEVRRWTADLESGDVFLFFFAGHGFTGPGGEHLLICRDDELVFLRHNRAGVSVDVLEELTNGKGFHRAFLLDACRTDVFAGQANRGGETRDLGLVALPDAGKYPGTCCVIRSCDRFCPALEYEDLGHGVFTRALLDLVDDDASRGIPLGDAFVSLLRSRMNGILAAHGMSAEQNPCSQANGNPFHLFEAPPPSPATVPAASDHVVCPVCGKKNHPEDTFRCKGCGRDDLCLGHRDEETYLCRDCLKKAREEAERKALAEASALIGEGKQLEGSGDFARAAECFRKAADLGDKWACQKYGDILFAGRYGVEKDVVAAFGYYQKADTSNSWVQHNLGSCHLEFFRRTGNRDEAQQAVEWLLRSAEAGLPWACVKMGDCCRDGIGVGQDFAQAAAWYRRVAGRNPEGDFGAAQWAEWNLGELYRNGQGVERNLDEALGWYRKATARNGDAAKQSAEAAAGVEKEIESECPGQGQL